jgi:hypothetical protein
LVTESTQFKVGIAVVAATWFNAHQLDQLVNTDTYRLFREDHFKKKSGGLTIYVNNDIDAKLVFAHKHSELMHTEVL